MTLSLSLVIATCFAMSFALRSAAIARLILGRFSLALHTGATHAFEFCGTVFLLDEASSLLVAVCTVFLLNAAVFVDLALYLVVRGLCLGLVELSSSHSLSQARLLSARDLQHLTWRLRGCLLEICIPASSD